MHPVAKFRQTAVQALRYDMPARMKHALQDTITSKMFLLLPTLHLEERTCTARTKCVPLHIHEHFLQNLRSPPCHKDQDPAAGMHLQIKHRCALLLDCTVQPLVSHQEHP
jgi:hypothetical protein